MLTSKPVIVKKWNYQDWLWPIKSHPPELRGAQFLLLSQAAWYLKKIRVVNISVRTVFGFILEKTQNNSDYFILNSHRSSEIDNAAPFIIKNRLILFFYPMVFNMWLPLSRWLLKLQPSLSYPRQEKEEEGCIPFFLETFCKPKKIVFS